MDLEATRAAYARALTDSVSISGSRGTGANKAVYASASVRARVIGYTPQEIVGTIMQGDQKAILFKPDLDAKGFPGAPQKGDKITIAGRTTTVQYCDANTRKIGTETVAYECQVRGS